MAIRYVSPNGGGDGTTPTSRWTMAQANAGLFAGDTAELATGTYTTDILPARSGTAASPITIRSVAGGRPFFNGAKADLRSRAYVAVVGLTFNSLQKACVETSNDSFGIILDSCTFENSVVMTGSTTGWSPDMLAINGDWHIVRKCVFKTWYGMNTMTVAGEHHLFEDCDFNLNDAGHGSIHVQGSHCVVRRCYVRNKWSGIREFVGRPEVRTVGTLPNPAPGNLYEDNTFYDCNLTDAGTNEGYPVQGWQIVQQVAVGDAQTTKPGGTGPIWRGNLFVGGNEVNTHSDSTYHYKAVCQIGNYGSATIPGQQMIHWQNERWYHNTFYDNGMSAVSITRTADYEMYSLDNRWLNNIIDGQEDLDFYLSPSGRDYADTWQFHRNIVTGISYLDGKWAKGLGYSFPTFITKWTARAGVNASQASGNLTTRPTFVSPGHSTVHANRSLYLNRDNYRLQAGSVGKRQAIPLAKVTAASTGTTIDVTDAYVFYPNSNATVEGDVILIGTATRRVMTRVSPTRITVDQAIPVAVNDQVWLAKYGSAPDIGLTGVETSIKKSPTFHTSDGYAGDLSTFVTSSFTAPAGGIVIATVGYRSFTATPPTIEAVNVTSTFGGSPVWTKQAEHIRVASINTCIAVFTAQMGASPGSGTISFTASDAIPSGWKVITASVVGQNRLTPVRQVRSGGNSAAELTMTMEQVPLATSIVLGGVHSRGTVTNIIPRAGYTELYEDINGTVPLEVQWNLDAPDGLVSWTGLATTANVAIAIEIADGGAATAFFDATPVTTGAPVLDAPTIGQAHLLVASLTTGAPVLDTPILGKPIGTGALETAAPVLGNPAIVQVQNITALGLSTGQPILGNPVAQVLVAGEIVALSLRTDSPILGKPVVGQVHHFLAAQVGS